MSELSPNWLAAVDPGLNRSGVALFHRGDLWDVQCVHYPDVGSVGGRAIEMGLAIGGYVLGRVSTVDVLAAEWPQIYQRGQGRTKGNPNDLVPLAGVIGAVAADVSPKQTRIFLPSEWKGQVPKDTMKSRIVGALTDAELSRVPKRLAHDGYDAIGVGLFALGRLARKRVIDRE